jgi:hypothetical protein
MLRNPGGKPMIPCKLTLPQDRYRQVSFAVICEEPLIEWSLGDDRLWKIFGSESLLYVCGCEVDRDPNWIARSNLERDVLPPQSLAMSESDRVA